MASIVMIRGNVERIVETQAQAEALKLQGFKPIEGEKPVDAEETQAQAEDLNKLTVKQLRSYAAKLGIAGAAGLTKSELLELLEGEK